MNQKDHPTSAASPFKKFKPKPITLSIDELVKMHTLYPDNPLPLVIQSETATVDLQAWVKNNLELVEQKLSEHGAILFRGYHISTPVAFEDFAHTITPELFNENGEHPRSSVSGNVYTPVFFPPEKKLLWHNENSFNERWPMKIWFCCVKPADEGGETPLVDSRKVFEAINPKIRDRFREKKVMYARNYGGGLGLSWQDVFQTTDKSKVEEFCRNASMDFEWKSDDRLRTSYVRPGVAEHPKTHALVWFNQAQHWHTSCLDSKTRASLLSMFEEKDLPRNCYYGDGSPIEDSVMQEICDIYQQLEVSFPWQRGDVVMLDNMLTAHARNPFRGERKILVAMGEMASTSDKNA